MQQDNPTQILFHPFHHLTRFDQYMSIWSTIYGEMTTPVFATDHLARLEFSILDSLNRVTAITPAPRRRALRILFRFVRIDLPATFFIKTAAACPAAGITLPLG